MYYETLCIGTIRPVLGGGANRSLKGVMLYLAQIMTGHGCFDKFLWDENRRPNAISVAASKTRHTVHTRQACPAFDEQQSFLTAVAGHDHSLPTVVSTMVSSERSWSAAAYCHDVLSRKRAAERKREEPTPPTPCAPNAWGESGWLTPATPLPTTAALTVNPE